MQKVVENKEGHTPIKVLAKVLQLARLEKQRLEDLGIMREVQEELTNRVPPGFCNKASYYLRKLVIYPEDSFKGWWDLLIFT